MSAAKKKAGLFDDLEDEKPNRKTAKREPTEANAATEVKRGRPKNKVETVQMLLRPKPDNARKLRVYAAERGIRTSAVLDALVERCLDTLDM